MGLEDRVWETLPSQSSLMQVCDSTNPIAPTEEKESQKYPSAVKRQNNHSNCLSTTVSLHQSISIVDNNLDPFIFRWLSGYADRHVM